MAAQGEEQLVQPQSQGGGEPLLPAQVIAQAQEGGEPLLQAQPDANHTGGLGEWLALLRKPTINAAMINPCVGHSDWRKNFQDWNVVFAWAAIILAIVNFILANFVMHKLKMKNVWPPILSLIIWLFFTYLSWFCVTKQTGGCGKIGYAIWGIGLVVLALQPYIYTKFGKATCIYLIILIPMCYMIWACFKLFMGTEGPARTMAVVADEESAQTAAMEEAAAAPVAALAPPPTEQRSSHSFEQSAPPPSA